MLFLAPLPLFLILSGLLLKPSYLFSLTDLTYVNKYVAWGLRDASPEQATRLRHIVDCMPSVELRKVLTDAKALSEANELLGWTVC